MKKPIFLILIIVIILVASLYYYLTLPTDQQKIQQQINQANYCQQTSDCVQLTSQCPFGCYVYVNVNEANRIKQLITAYQSDCVYGCIDPPPFECRDNKCFEILE